MSSNKTHYFSLILGLFVMILLLGCGGPMDKTKNTSEMTNKLFSAWEIVTIDEMPESLRKEYADACIKAMAASRNQVNGGADDQDLEDVVIEIRATMLTAYIKPTTYLILKESSDDPRTNGLRINVTGFMPTQIDSILTKYEVN